MTAQFGPEHAPGSFFHFFTFPLLKTQNKKRQKKKRTFLPVQEWENKYAIWVWDWDWDFFGALAFYTLNK